MDLEEIFKMIEKFFDRIKEQLNIFFDCLLSECEWQIEWEFRASEKKIIIGE